jgi:hypothetical protein
MSIHIYTSRIKDMLGNSVRYSLPDDHTKLNSIIATGIKGKKPHILKIDNYTEDNLIALVTRNNQANHYKHLYVDYRFWNYKYCSPENLQTENLKWMMEIPPSEEPYIQTHMFYVGLITVTIMYYSVLYHSLLVSNALFETYMSLINIDKNDFSRFLTQSGIYFPLTKNFLTLLKRIFTQETIREYLFPENGSFYTPYQVREILEYFEIRDIQEYVKLIYEMNSSSSENNSEDDKSERNSSDSELENKYHLLNVIFDLYDGSIDYYQKVFAVEEMETKPVGYYLELLKPFSEEGDLDNLYQELIEKYSLLDGAETIELF